MTGRLYPYGELVASNRQEFEYELLNTRVFDLNLLFDVFVEYANAAPEDILIQMTIFNRSPELAVRHVLPTL